MNTNQAANLAGEAELTIAALAARLRDLEAKEQIRELLDRYCFTADTGDAQGWSEVFAQDGTFATERGVVQQGREQFYRGIADPDGLHKQKIENRGSLHTTGSVTIRVNGDTAWAEGPTIVWVVAERGWRPITMAYNHWDLRRTDGRWEIAHRHARAVAPGNAPLVYTHWKDAI